MSASLPHTLLTLPPKFSPLIPPDSLSTQELLNFSLPEFDLAGKKEVILSRLLSREAPITFSDITTPLCALVPPQTNVHFL